MRTTAGPVCRTPAHGETGEHQPDPGARKRQRLTARLTLRPPGDRRCGGRQRADEEGQIRASHVAAVTGGKGPRHRARNERLTGAWRFVGAVPADPADEMAGSGFRQVEAGLVGDALAEALKGARPRLGGVQRLGARSVGDDQCTGHGDGNGASVWCGVHQHRRDRCLLSAERRGKHERQHDGAG